MEGFVDIHSHILPNIDDGSTSAEETFEMFEQAYAEGIKTIYATPHCGLGYDDFDIEEAEAVFQLVADTLEKMHPDMALVLGNEVLYYENMVEDLKAGKIHALGNSPCVLIEFLPDTDFEIILAAVRDLKAAHYVPVIAHVERYSCIQNDLGLTDQLHGEGAYLQVNADMLLEPPVEETSNGVIGIFKFPPMMTSIQMFKNTAWQLIKAGQVDFLASDAHGSEYRKPVMKTALQMIYKYVDPEAALKIVDKGNILG